VCSGGGSNSNDGAAKVDVRSTKEGQQRRAQQCRENQFNQPRQPSQPYHKEAASSQSKTATRRVRVAGHQQQQEQDQKQEQQDEQHGHSQQPRSGRSGPQAESAAALERAVTYPYGRCAEDFTECRFNARHVAKKNATTAVVFILKCLLQNHGLLPPNQQIYRRP